MSWVGWLAAAFGLLTLIAVALMMPPKTVQDPTMKYEAMVAVGFGMLLFAGPLWLLQLGFTIAAAVSGGGDALLWVWLFCAPPACRRSGRFSTSSPDDGRPAAQPAEPAEGAADPNHEAQAGRNRATHSMWCVCGKQSKERSESSR